MSIPSGLQPSLTLTSQVPPPLRPVILPSPPASPQVKAQKWSLYRQGCHGRQPKGVGLACCGGFRDPSEGVDLVSAPGKGSHNPDVFDEGIQLGQGMRTRPVGSWRRVISTRGSGPANLEVDCGEYWGGQNRWCVCRSCSSSCCLTSIAVQATPRLWPCHSQVSPTPVLTEPRHHHLFPPTGLEDRIARKYIKEA